MRVRVEKVDVLGWNKSNISGGGVYDLLVVMVKTYLAMSI